LLRFRCCRAARYAPYCRFSPLSSLYRFFDVAFITAPLMPYAIFLMPIDAAFAPLLLITAFAPLILILPLDIFLFISLDAAFR